MPLAAHAMPNPDRRAIPDRRQARAGGRRIEDFQRHRDGDPVSTGDLGTILGLSPAFIRSECDADEIPRATPTTSGWFRVGRGKKREYRIQWRAARAYLVKLGLVAH